MARKTVKGVEFLDELGLVNLGVAYHISNNGNGHNYRVVDIIEDVDSDNDMHRRV